MRDAPKRENKNNDNRVVFFMNPVEFSLETLSKDTHAAVASRLAKRRGFAYECVVRGNAQSLLCCRPYDLFIHAHDDDSTKTTVTLLGLSILHNQFHCMTTLLWLGACPDDICATYMFTFMQWHRWVNMTARDLCKTNVHASITLQLFEKRRAQLSAMQWVLVNIPACWRDLSEDVLRRLRYA